MIPMVARAAKTSTPTAARTDGRPRGPASVGDRLARASLWAVLVVLLLREGADDMRMLRLRARRTAAAWWGDVDRRSRQDVRRSQIGLVASRIGTRADRPGRPAGRRSST